MKYIYKNTGCLVESDVKLDSAIFIPVEDKEEEKKEPVKKAKTTSSKKKTAEK